MEQQLPDRIVVWYEEWLEHQVSSVDSMGISLSFAFAAKGGAPERWSISTWLGLKETIARPDRRMENS